MPGVPYFALVAILYLILNWSYTNAVFTDPGSPSHSSINISSLPAYSQLPMNEPERHPDLPVFTVKASGAIRFCKKCEAKKPDRAHHCSTCNSCRLKMDHHCPWLATCVGLRNYKPFILFCAYTTVFCYACFLITAAFLWSELGTVEFVNSGGFMGVNVVLLAVLSGIISVVLTAFTAWHFSLAICNQTTIECLEKTRYLSPLRRNMQRRARIVNENGEESVSLLQRYGQQLTDIHTNALPGVTRPEEGEERFSPVVDGSLTPGPSLSASESLRLNYANMERQRERERYEDYLDEKDSEKLPHAFDLGWRRNLRAVFGPRPWLWVLPVPNSIGDGWHWEASAKWFAARDRLRREREHEWAEQTRQEEVAGWGHQRQAAGSGTLDAVVTGDDEHLYPNMPNGIAATSLVGQRSPGRSNRLLGRSLRQNSSERFNEDEVRPNSGMSLKTLHFGPTRASDTASLDGLYSDDEEN